MGMPGAHQSRVSAVPAHIKNEHDEAQQPANTSANQQTSVRRTTPDISVAGAIKTQINLHMRSFNEKTQGNKQSR